MNTSRRTLLAATTAGAATALIAARARPRVRAQAPSSFVTSGSDPAPASGTTVSLPTLPAGATLYYETQGSGRPLLVLHGGPGLDHSCFLPWLDPLARALQLVYPDLRGNGRSSDVPDDELTYAAMVDDLDALREHLGIVRWAVLGHSFGGLIAQLYALAHPERVSYLILLDTSPAWSKLGNAEGLQIVSGRVTPTIMAAAQRAGTLANDEEYRAFWHTLMPLYFHRFDVASLIAADRTIYRVRANARGAALRDQWDTRARLGEIAAPTLVAVGRHDFSTPVRHSQILYKGIPGAELTIFEESGHYPFIEEQERFLEVTRRFLVA